MSILHSSLSWRKVCNITSSTSNSKVANISISTHMFLQYLSSDPHAYASSVPPGNPDICHQSKGPRLIPLVMQHQLHSGHDTLPLHGDSCSAMNCTQLHLATTIKILDFQGDSPEGRNFTSCKKITLSNRKV